jgi:predicted dehydrogenase
MPKRSAPPIGVAMVGVGAVTDYHHIPAARLDSRCRVIAICDESKELLENRRSEWGIDYATTDYRELCKRDDVDAVVIATPNWTHCEMAVAFAQAGKHIMCEKPLGLNAGEVRRMYHAARDNGVVHMTAFTYRFAPSMRYLRSLLKAGQLGEPRHFRSQRFLDWPETSWGWRQYKSKAGAGDLFDMTIHRIDFAIDLLGPIETISGAVATFCPRDKDKEGKPCPPSEVDDWSCLIGEFESGATGVWEGTTLAKGYHRNGFGHEWAEINGSEGSAVYQLHEPNRILLGKTGSDLAPVDVPEEFLKPADSPRKLGEGLPATVFRYDLMWEFISAIAEGREAVPNFYDGLRSQIVADATLDSYAQRRWIEIPDEPV